MTERNPYDFVPFEGTPTIVESFTTLERYAGCSGWLTFSLQVLTPLLIHQDPGQSDRDGVYSFAHLNGQSAIPATSLKGMLRSAHETITNSTLGVLNLRKALRRPHNESRLLAKIPSAYHPSHEAQHLTASEIVFGMVGGDETVGQAGRLFLDDIRLSEGDFETIQLWRPRGGQPKPEHESFYFDSHEQALGRKFYFHQDFQRAQAIYADERRSASEPRRVQVIKGRILTGQLRFQNLSQELLAGLVYAMQLEDGMAHKLGYGKGLGMGSVKLTIKELHWFEGGPQRFLSLDSPGTADHTADVPALVTAIKQAWLVRSGGSSSYAAFAELLRWQTSEIFIYPSYSFFRGGSTVSLGQYQRQALASQGRSASIHTGSALSPLSADQQTHTTGQNTTPPTPAPDTTRYQGQFLRAERSGWGIRHTTSGNFFAISPTKRAKELANQLLREGREYLNVSYMLISKEFGSESQLMASDVQIEETES